MNRTVYLLRRNGRGKYFFLVLICLFVFRGISQAQTLKADYQFQGNLNSSVAGAPPMSNLTGSGANSFQNDLIDGYTRQIVRFPFNSGLSVNINGVIPNNSYSIVMLLRVDETSGIRRLVSFDNGTTNNGAYLQDGRIRGENVSAAPLFPNTYVQIVIVRDTTGGVRIYRDGVQRVNVTNDGGEFQISNASVLQFFQDDVLTPNEATAGNVARIRLYDAPLDSAQIGRLERPANANGGGLQDVLFISTRDGNKEIYSMNGDGTNQKRLTFNQTDDYDAKWSNDKTKIVFTRNEWIWVINADGSNETRLTNTAASDHAPDWMPLGGGILFSRCNVGVCDLYTMTPTGANQQPLPNVNTSGNEDRAEYSLVSNIPRIVFQCSGSNFSNMNICEADTNGSNRRQITNTLSPIGNYMPTYAYTGAILFRRVENNADALSSDIYVMDGSGGNLVNLTSTPNTLETAPFWLSFDSKIIFASQRDTASTQIYTANSNGGAVQRVTNNSASDVPSDVYRGYIYVDNFGSAPFDFDGDGKTDVGIYRPAQSEWWIQKSFNNQTLSVQFGQAGDRFVPADYTGDGKTDIAVFRPSNGFWYVLRSETNTFYGFQFGTDGDIPIPGDFDGDVRADAAVYRPSNNGWYIMQSSAGFTSLQFGASGDVPVPADFEGDGKTDVAIYRPNGASGAEWWIRRSSNSSVFSLQFGTAEDKPIPYDFTGDRRADIAVFRPSNGFWYVLRSENNSFYGFQFGANGDIPAPGDYDGDIKIDAAVFRPSSATWYILRSTAGTQIFNYGLSTDQPIPSAYVR